MSSAQLVNVAVSLAWLSSVGLAYWAGGTIFAIIVASVPIWIASQLLPSGNRQQDQPKPVKPSTPPSDQWSD